MVPLLMGGSPRVLRECLTRGLTRHQLTRRDANEEFSSRRHESRAATHRDSCDECRLATTRKFQMTPQSLRTTCQAAVPSAWPPRVESCETTLAATLRHRSTN